MQFLSISHRASSRRALTDPSHLFSCRFFSLVVAGQSSSPLSSSAYLAQSIGASSLQNHGVSAASSVLRKWLLRPQCSMIFASSFSSGLDLVNTNPTEPVKEVYDKMLQSIKEKRSAPPNAWLWSLIENCKIKDDVKLLFDILHNLRMFRLSNLHIHDNFNCNLCREVTKACVRVGAIDFGQKALWKHNVYGLSPTIGSANHLLSYAKAQKDSELMTQVMKLIKRNDLPLQPSTADIVFSICHDTGNWELISKYSRLFLKAGVKLRKEAFGSWMDLAANRGDVESLCKIEKLRSNVYTQHNIRSGFACAKGLLLEQKPDAAAAVIQVLNETLSGSKRPGIMAELQKLASDWPSEAVKHQKEQDKEALAAALESSIPALISSLAGRGVDAAAVNTKGRTQI